MNASFSLPLGFAQSITPGLRTELKTSPQRFKEVTCRIEWHTANHIPQRGSEEHRQQDARSAEHRIKKVLPDRIMNVSSELDADPAQDEQPQHHHQWKIEAAEAGCVKLWEGKVE